ncbi:MAG: phosphate ABC transporter ATP-binding protein [Actinomycetota bacterium]|nr:phosphate ABC transporter ATP-binding protein [Actinomycetota bacterium]
MTEGREPAVTVDREQPRHSDVTGAPALAHLYVEDLVLRRGGQAALDGVTAGFPRGRTTAIVGPSGAGKTSLLRCLNRLEEPSHGRVLLDGVDIRTFDPRVLRRRVGMVFQTPVLFRGDVQANLAYGLDHPEPDLLLRALEAAQLPPQFLHRNATALSVGEAQRVTIARALVRHPDVILLDEPTSALDRDTAAGIEGLIRDLAIDGLTVVLVSHDLAQAHRIAEHALLLVRGHVAASGPVHEVSAAWPVVAL